jgi:starch phosphorylase
VYYLSMEFLLGRSLASNAINARLADVVFELIKGKRNVDPALIETEPDAGLGNGGLGRLAACFLDSMATLALPAMGYGLRYEYGIFRQTIQDGWQVEQPDNWLRRQDPWEVARLEEAVEVKLNTSFELRAGELQPIPGRPSVLLGIPFDRPVIGYGGKTINTLRLWAAATPDYFDFQRFSRGDFVGALAETLASESLTRVLYPDDSTSRGQGLRFLQEYFLVACSLADLVRRFRRANADWSALPEKAAIQLNDTHPAMAVPELMRILLDEARLGWDQAWDLTRRTLAYTNHTLLPEALEKWPLEWFELLLPRNRQIIEEINRRLLDEVRTRFPGDDGRVARVSVLEEGAVRQVRMANLAIVGSHSTNGVSAIHSQLLRERTVRDLAEMFPERFNNKTNGVTPRRWLLACNPELAQLIIGAIGDGWITDLSQLARLKPLAGDKKLQQAFLKAKRAAKARFVDWLKTTTGEVVDPETIFDCQIKRIHEYKRQLLNALHIVVLYNRLKDNPNLEFAPRTFFFAGKAAPAYALAKVIIKFINSLASTINADPSVNRRLKVLFLPDYCVSLAERLIPATDVSEQISTAGYEASGTSNMKFMMNGALTIGTLDGANIEMAEEAGRENLFLFGLTAEQVAGSHGWYSPHWHYEHEPETRAALDLIFSEHFNRHEPGIFNPIRDALLTHGDHYMHLADLKSYSEAHERVGRLYADRKGWAERAILNIASSGRFSSDRTIAEYAQEIWSAAPCPVP